MELVLLSLGILVAIGWSVFRTPNPARVPFRRLAGRALGGLSVWFFVSLTLSALVWYTFARALVSASDASGFRRLSAALVLGLVLANFAKLKDVLIPYWLARRFKRPFQIIQEYDEFTRLYLSRIISREERKIHSEFFDDVSSNELERRKEALRRLFDFHQVEIALALRRQAPHGDADRILTPFRFRHPDMQFKLLLRFLGYRRATSALEALTRQPDLLRVVELPPDESITEDGTSPPNRDIVVRTLASPYVRDYLLQQE